MMYFEIYILIPLLAIAIDWLHTVLRLPRVVIFGTTAEPRRSGEQVSGQGSALRATDREYVCAIHNEGDRVFEDRQFPVLVGLEFLGGGEFRDGQLEGFIGPNRDVAARWMNAGTRKRKLIIEIARLRPWKTLFFKVKVPAGTTYELRMEVLVPSRTLFRSMLRRLNEHLYAYSRLDYSSASIVVRGGPVRKSLLGGVKGWLQIALPMFFIMGFFYRVLWNVLLVPLRDRAMDPMSGVAWTAFYQPQWVYLDLVALVLGMTLLFVLFREKGRPIGSGYRLGVPITIEEYEAASNHTAS